MEYEILFIIAILVVLIAGIVGCIFFVTERAVLPGQLAEIEQLRQDAARTDLRNSEDIAGQVAAVNRYIRSKQAYNQRWWAALFIPNKWDEVEVIAIPHEVGQRREGEP